MKTVTLCLSRYRNRNINRCFINEMSSHVTQNTTCWKLVYDDGENRFIVQNSWKKMRKPWNYGKSVPSIIHGLERYWIHCSLDDFNTTKYLALQIIYPTIAWSFVVSKEITTISYNLVIHCWQKKDLSFRPDLK